MTTAKTGWVDLMRHGEPQGGQRYRGKIDDPLSDKGWQQMRDAVGDHHPWDHIITSPLSRCADFADELSIRHHIPVITEQRLCELGFGVWEGCTPEQLRADDPDILTRFYHDPIANQPQGAEPLAVFGERMSSVWQDVLQDYQGQRVLIIAHAGVIRGLISTVLGMPIEHLFRVQVANAAISRIKCGLERPPALVFHDRVL